MSKNKLETILLYEAHDLEVMEAFLTSFLVFKVSSDLVSQKMWDSLDSQASNLHGVGIGLIREEWKQSANFFSQRYAVVHTCPQLVLVKRRRVMHVWYAKDWPEVDLSKEVDKVHARHDKELQALMSFCQLRQLGELESNDPRWQIAWLSSFQKSLLRADLSDSMRESLEVFSRHWLEKLPGDWKDCPPNDRAEFFKQAHQLAGTWWKEVSEAESLTSF